ncbi:hypothetical protein SNE40_016972 [Patella caerulea]|uniref:EGF-like domain-containing protein n=1 Tax=Patella caerulea TaxID=87958 RepID=A0AAN8JCR4_PATCE
MIPCLPCPDGGTSGRGSRKCTPKQPHPVIEDHCKSSPCGNGTCQNRKDNFTCSCFSGYRGDRCEIAIDVCTNSRCENGGRCTADGSGYYTCVCPKKFSGFFCQLSALEGNHSRWEEWSPWSNCSAKTCGEGIQNRSRICVKNAKQIPCHGDSSEKRFCNKAKCPVCSSDDLLIPFGTSVNCSGSTRSTVCRPVCDPEFVFKTKPPAYTCINNKWSPGKLVQPCVPVSFWFKWSPWSECTSQCSGERMRVRTCNSTHEHDKSRHCPGEDFQKMSCKRKTNATEDVCNDCSEDDLVSAYGVSVNCTRNNSLTCKLTCDPGLVFINEPPVFTCNNGLWTPSKNLIPCTNIVPPETLSVKFITQYPDLKCGDCETTNDIKWQLLKKSRAITCVLSNKCLVDVKEIPCETKVRIQMSLEINSPSYNLSQLEDFVEDGTKNNILSELETSIRVLDESSLFVKKANFTVTVNKVATPEIRETSLGSVKCPNGTLTQGLLCVKCPPGTYFVDKACQMCPRGTYQIYPGRHSCESCPTATTTKNMGSFNATACLINNEASSNM